MIRQGKGIIYAAMAGLLAMLGGITWYASLDNPQLDLAEIHLADVKVTSVNSIEGKANLEVNFLIKNSGEKTFTISNIDYELFADGKPIGRGQYTTEDIPLPGRAAFYPNAEIALPSTFKLLSSVDSDAYNAIVNEEPVKFSAKGKMSIESAWSIVEKDFDLSQ
ncbi:MAG: hypothetical protein ACREAX_02435 [Candidatus Nitrosotenuis sp.]